jgi:hypothetical protein
MRSEVLGLTEPGAPGTHYGASGRSLRPGFTPGPRGLLPSIAGGATCYRRAGAQLRDMRFTPGGYGLPGLRHQEESHAKAQLYGPGSRRNDFNGGSSIPRFERK